MSEPKVQFQRAERKRAKIHLALTGPTGSGKTLSALLIARGLGERIAVIDTENDSASLYADATSKGIDFPFDVVAIDPPYTLEKHVEAIKAAIDAKYDVLVIDSLTHIWAGEGGMLEQKDLLDRAKPNSNSWANWREINTQFEEFRAWLLQADIHLIGTMRSKMKHEQIEQDGKKKVVKLGMEPIQRDGLEYEFTTVLDLTASHYADTSKDRTGLFDGKPFQPSVETGRMLLAWLNGAAAAPRALPVTRAPAPRAAAPAPAVSAPATPSAAEQWVVATPDEVKLYRGKKNTELPPGVKWFKNGDNFELRIKVVPGAPVPAPVAAVAPQQPAPPVPEVRGKNLHKLLLGMQLTYRHQLIVLEAYVRPDCNWVNVTDAEADSALAKITELLAQADGKEMFLGWLMDVAHSESQPELAAAPAEGGGA